MWLSKEYGGIEQVRKAREDIHFRWDDFIVSDVKVTRFFTMFTATEILLTQTSVEVEGGLRATIMEQAGEEIQDNEKWALLIEGTTNKIMSLTNSAAEQQIFDALPEEQHEVLRLSQDLKVARLMGNRLTAGQHPFATSDEEDGEMSIYESLCATKGQQATAERYLQDMSGIAKRQLVTAAKLPSNKRRQRDAKAAAV